LTIAASPGTNSSFNRGELCQSDYATGRINDSFCTLVLVAAKSVKRAFTLFYAGLDDYLFVIIQPCGCRKYTMPDFCFQMFGDKPNIWQEIEVLFSQPVFNSPLGHYASALSSSRLTESAGCSLK
jgi:hypothetical protein